MISPMFGELFKELRKKRGYTLREYCRTFAKDPGNISKMERGIIPPPTNHDELRKLALSLGLKEDSDEWDNFFTVANVSSGRIPQEIMSDEEVLSHLPIILRTIHGQKLTEDKLRSLIDIIKKE